MSINIEIIEFEMDKVTYFYPFIMFNRDLSISTRNTFKYICDCYEIMDYNEYLKETSKYETIIKYDTYMFLWRKDCENFIDNFLYPSFIVANFS